MGCTSDGQQSWIVVRDDGPGISATMTGALNIILDRLTRMKPAELKAYLTRAHAIVAAGLTKKARAALGLA